MRFAYVAAGAVVIGATVSEARSVASSPKPLEKLAKRQNYQAGLPLEPLKFGSSAQKKLTGLASQSQGGDGRNANFNDDADDVQAHSGQRVALPAGLGADSALSEPANAEKIKGELQALLLGDEGVSGLSGGLPSASTVVSNGPMGTLGSPQALLVGGSNAMANKAVASAGGALPTSWVVDRSVLDAAQGLPSPAADTIWVIDNSANGFSGSSDAALVKVLQVPASSLSLTPLSPAQKMAQGLSTPVGATPVLPLLRALKHTPSHSTSQSSTNDTSTPNQDTETLSNGTTTSSTDNPPPPPPAYRAVKDANDTTTTTTPSNTTTVPEDSAGSSSNSTTTPPTSSVANSTSDSPPSNSTTLAPDFAPQE